MEVKLKVFIVGSGAIAYEHAKNIPHDLAQLTGIIEINEEQARAFINMYPNIEYYKNIDIFLNREPGKTDLVVVATPPPSHFELCSKLIDKGYNILCEKPLAINFKMAKKLSENTKNKRIIAASCESRFSDFKPVKLAAKYIKDGKIGDVYLVEQKAHSRLSRNGIEYQPESKWFLNKELSGGGVALDWGIYDLGVLHAVIAGVKSCDVHYAKLKNKLASVPRELEVLYDVEEYVYAVSDFVDVYNNKFTYVNERSCVCHGREEWYMKILGTKGGIQMKWVPFDKPYFEFYAFDSNGKPLTIKHQINPEYNFHDYPIKNIINSIITGEEPAISFEKAALNIDYIMQVYTKSGYYEKGEK